MDRIWTDEEIEYLKNNYPFVIPMTLSKEMGIDKEEIKKKGIELGLKKMVIRSTRTETHAPCAGCREWHPVEDFNSNASAARGLQDNCRHYDKEYRKKNPIDRKTMDRYIKNMKKNKEIKKLKESSEYQAELAKMTMKKETENICIVCTQCGEEKLGKEFGFRNMARKSICLECERHNRDVKKAEKILNGIDY